MKIRKYGITLHRLREEHLELVRQMRNRESIRKYMFYKEEITPEMQQKWFQTIFDIHNYYFVIEYNKELIGLVHGKNIDYINRTTEGGIFIWEEKYWSTPVPALVSIIMDDLTFRLMEMKKTYAEVQMKNERQISYNKQLGYDLEDFNESEGKLMMVLTRESYHTKGKKIREAVMKLGKDLIPLSWNDVDLEDVTQEEIKYQYSGLPEHLQRVADRKIFGVKNS